MADERKSPTEIRLMLGEAHVLCNECFARLHSEEGFEDRTRPCPHPKKCRDEQELMRTRRLP